MPAADFATLANIIELSVAPVFLLVAIGSFLNVATTRLGRVVDRARRLEDEIPTEKGEMRAVHMRELGALGRRMTFANWAINLSAAAALLVAIDVALLFIGALAGVNTMGPAALLFIIAMIGVIGGLCAFLIEISIATQTVRVRAELLTRKD